MRKEVGAPVAGGASPVTIHNALIALADSQISNEKFVDLFDAGVAIAGCDQRMTTLEALGRSLNRLGPLVTLVFVEMIRRGLSIDARYEMQVDHGILSLTPLHDAVMRGTPELVSLLLANGADPHAPMRIAKGGQAPRDISTAMEMVRGLQMDPDGEAKRGIFRSCQTRSLIDQLTGASEARSSTSFKQFSTYFE